MNHDPAPGDRDDLDRAKSVLRLRARAARRAVLPELRAAAAYAIAERALSLPEFRDASSALLYGPAPEEADIGVLEFALRDLGVRIAYPRVAENRTLALHWVIGPEVLQPGAFGLLEPVAAAPRADLESIAVIAVPGVAFDPLGNRLGFGGGYYDSLLAHSPLPPTVGIAYDEQVFGEVPHDGRDRPVDILITPTRTIRPATSRP